MSLTVADVVDLEVQLFLDRDADPSALVARDRALEVLAGDEPEETLRNWLSALRLTYASTPGRSFTRAVRVTRAVAILIGVSAGGALGAGLLAYDGSQPINVLNVFAIAAFAQGVLAAVSILGLLTWKFAPSVFSAIPFLDDFRALGRAGQRFVLSRLERTWTDERLDGAASVVHRLRTRNGLYARVESWSAFSAVQWFAIAFNIGLLVAMVRLVALTDLTFGWGTTLSIGDATLAEICQAAAAPWGWLVADAVPSSELVSSTNFARFDGTFAVPTGADISAQWWPFIVASTVFYGLIPRLALGVTGFIGLRRALRTVPLDTPDVERVLRRLATPAVAAVLPSESDGDATLPDEPELPSLAETAVDSYAIRWGALPGDEEALAKALATELGARVSMFHHAGGKDYREDEANLERLGSAEEIERLIVIAEAFDEPDRAMRRFIAACRDNLESSVPIIVAVLGEVVGDQVHAPTPSDLTRWRRMLGTVADPYLDVQPLGEES